jgi:hypothetical protein
MPHDLTASILFVDENGSLLEKARLLRILLDEKPSPAVYEKLLSLQNPDGGFPSRPRGGSASSVDSTLTALWQLDELGMFETPEARRGMGFLVDQQGADGGWDENPNLPGHDLPPWIRPGETTTRLYLSTYAAYWLGLGGKEYQAELQKAAAFLAAWQGAPTSETKSPPPSAAPVAPGQIPGYLHNNWLGASAFLLAGPGYAQNAQNTLDFLQSRPFSAWEDSQIAWAIDCLVRAGLPTMHPFVQDGISTLQQRRASDGSWASDDGPAFAAAATVGVIKVLSRLGL